MATRKSKRLQNLTDAKNIAKINDNSDDYDKQTKKTHNVEKKRIQKLLKDSFVLLQNTDENQFIELTINDDSKSYTIRKGKIGNKGRKTYKKFTSKTTTFDTAIILLLSKINEDFIIVEEYDDKKEKEYDNNDENIPPNINDSQSKSYKKFVVVGSAPVDEYFPGDSSVRVFEENGIVYDAMLNQTNIHQNNNKFYKIQILQDNTGKIFCWFRWGRVGYKGQTSLTYGTKDEMINKFINKFYDKTLNEFSDRNNFQTYARKYTYLPMDYSNNSNDPWNDNENEEKELKIESKLHSEIQELIKLLFDKKMMEDHMREIGYDANKLPLGKIDEEVIKNAYMVLKDIEYELRQKDDIIIDNNNSNNSKRRRLNSTKSSRKVNRYAITELSSKYYTLIPHEFGYKIPPPINTEILLKQEMKLIEALSEIEVASRLLLNNKKKNVIKNPIDKHFDLLKTDLEYINCNENIYKILTKYVLNTHAETHNRYTLNIESIFRINKENDNKRFIKWGNNNNRMLLYHGSRMTNYVGILSNGLRIAPPEAPVTGYMFGKGIYFADMSSKSANYCFTTKDNNIGLLLLCEVALGEMNELYYSDYNAKNKLNGKHSTKGVGKTEPNKLEYVKLENGCIVPLGKPIKNNQIKTSLLYNEYIVYDTSQIKMKYLLKVKFNYKDNVYEW